MDPLALAEFRQRCARLTWEMAACRTEYLALIGDGRDGRHLAAEFARLAAEAAALRQEWAARRG